MGRLHPSSLSLPHNAADHNILLIMQLIITFSVLSRLKTLCENSLAHGGLSVYNSIITPVFIKVHSLQLLACCGEGCMVGLRKEPLL